MSNNEICMSSLELAGEVVVAIAMVLSFLSWMSLAYEVFGVANESRLSLKFLMFALVSNTLTLFFSIVAYTKKSDDLPEYRGIPLIVIHILFIALICVDIWAVVQHHNGIKLQM